MIKVSGLTRSIKDDRLKIFAQLVKTKTGKTLSRVWAWTDLLSSELFKLIFFCSLVI